jgi:hypothetical protein
MTSIHFRFATKCHRADGWHGFPKPVVVFIEFRFHAPETSVTSELVWAKFASLVERC